MVGCLKCRIASKVFQPPISATYRGVHGAGSGTGFKTPTALEQPSGTTPGGTEPNPSPKANNRSGHIQSLRMGLAQSGRVNPDSELSSPAQYLRARQLDRAPSSQPLLGASGPILCSWKRQPCRRGLKSGHAQSAAVKAPCIEHQRG